MNICPEPLNQAQIDENKKKWEAARSKDGNSQGKALEKDSKHEDENDEQLN